MIAASDPQPAADIGSWNLIAAGSSIPDADAILADGSLRYVDLNRRITDSYTKFGTMFQDVIDPGAAARGTSSARPSWYAIGAYASRSAGKGMLAASVGLALVDNVFRSFDSAGSLTSVFPALGRDESSGYAQLIDGYLGMEEHRMAATFLVGMAIALDPTGGLLPTTSGLLDPRTLAISVERVMTIVRRQPGGTFRERLACVARTVRNGLEDGNRRIFADIGVGAQRYLEWRAGRTPSPTEVLSGFSLSSPPRPDEAREMFDLAVAAVDGGGEVASEFETRFPAPPYDLSNMLVASFALYEEARLAPDAGRRDRLVAAANNLMAWREQYEAAQRAFAPPAVLPGETERPPLFELVSPTVAVGFRFGEWSFTKFAAQRLPERDQSIWTPRVTEYSWGVFRDRWPAILDVFDQAYAHPDGMWPMPDPDPAKPV